MPQLLVVGLNGLEPSTSRLSGVRSNQLSYRPINNNWYFIKKLINKSLKTEYDTSSYYLYGYAKPNVLRVSLERR